MAERLKRAAAWLGLVTDDRYAEYDPDGDADGDTEQTEGISRDDLLGAREQTGGSLAAPEAATPRANVTTLESKRPAPPASAGRRPAPDSHGATALAPRPRTAEMSRITTVHPRTYNEARTIGEHFRDGVPVIMNLSEMEDVDAKRLVDFAAGLIFGLHGTIERVTSRVFLLSPQNVTVAAEDKERIAGGFFNQS